MLIQQLINGVLASGIYALFAVGFTMIFGIMGVLNMAHADFGMVAAVAIIWCVGAGVAPLPAVVVAAVVMLLIALIVERTALRPGRRYSGDAAVEMPLIASIGAGMILQNGAAVIFGNKALVFPLRLRGFFHVGDYLVSQGLALSLAVSAVLLAGLEVLVSHTGFGRQVRAVAQNRNAAEIMGINTERIILMAFAISALLAGVAGCLVGVSYGLVAPYMSIPYAIKGLVAMIVGGVGSLPGAVIGALLIGLAEALTVNWLGSQLRDVGVFAVLMLVLAIRPAGIFRLAAVR
ncbi:MAG: branched-chain amino acid ABC transporter permease [Acetobacteraceae bacterium]